MKQTLLIITALMLVVGFSKAQTYQFAETYYDNGMPKVIKTFKESKGKLELVNENKWHENGQKRWEGTYKNGEQDGVWTYWYENGQKSEERTFKDGELIEVTHWDEDGNEMNGKPSEDKLKVNISADEVAGNTPDIATLTEFGLTAKSLISQAEQLRDHRKYLDAIKKLEVLLEAFPDSPEAPDAQVLIAQIYMGYQNDFSSAVREFRKVVTNFPKSDQAHNAQFMMGYIYATHLNDKEMARTEFQKFIDLYSGEVEEYFLESAKAELRALED